MPLDQDKKNNLKSIVLTKKDLTKFVEEELAKHVMRVPGYERNYCEIRALVDDVSELNLEKEIEILLSFSGSPLILECIRNEPENTVDFS